MARRLAGSDKEGARLKLKRLLSTVDTHTAGGPTRTLIGGLPPLEGNSVAEKMEYFRTRHDDIRKLLMLEPRGHRDMSGTVVTGPSAQAAVGAFFITSGGYLRACIHSTIGTVAAGLTTGFLDAPADDTNQSILVEVPSGIVSVTPRYRQGALASLAVRANPAFLWKPSETLDLGRNRKVQVALAFSGVAFVLVEFADLDMPEYKIGIEDAKKFGELGTEVLAAANRQFPCSHPETRAPLKFELAMFYEKLGSHHAKDIVVGAQGAIDRSPCGAGTGALMAHLFARGDLKLHEDFTLQSFHGSRFIGRVTGTAKAGALDAVVPEVEGSAYITGMHQFVLDADDPMPEGLSL